MFLSHGMLEIKVAIILMKARGNMNFLLKMRQRIKLQVIFMSAQEHTRKMRFLCPLE
jgi:hypothetical protein